MTSNEEFDEEPAGAQVQPHDLPVVDTVLVLATDDPNLTERQRVLVLASLESDCAISDELAGEPGTDSGPGTPASGTEKAEVEPVGAFLKSIAVSGFRGIGAPARLDLQPRLTLAASFWRSR